MSEEPKRKWSVTGSVVASAYLGTVMAATKEQAEKLAWKQASVSVCHQCSHEISDPEVEEITVEPVEDES